MAEDRFVRDPATICTYAALGSYAYVLYSLGLVLPFLRSGLHLSYTVTSLHSTVFAAGSIVAGVGFEPMARRFGRHATFWSSAAAMAVGLLLMSVGHVVAVTLTSAVLMGAAGGFLLVSTSVVLSDRHGVQRDRAFVEANVVASACAVLAPLGVGAAARTPAGWRVGLLVPVVAVVVLYAVFRRVGLPEALVHVTDTGRRLPRAYWLLNALVALVVALEFCVVLWGVELLRVRHHLETATAGLLLTVFYVGELVGRAVGSALTRPGRAPTLIVGATALSATGFLLFWLSGLLWPAVLGLALTGLGVANLYPLSLSLAVAAAPGRTELAAARAQLSVGGAVVAVPFLLGALADRLGVGRAFSLELLLLAATPVLLYVGMRAVAASSRSPVPAP